MTLTLTPEQYFAVYSAISSRQMELSTSAELVAWDKAELNHLDVAEVRLTLAWAEATRS